MAHDVHRPSARTPCCTGDGFVDGGSPGGFWLYARAGQPGQPIPKKYVHLEAHAEGPELDTGPAVEWIQRKLKGAGARIEQSPAKAYLAGSRWRKAVAEDEAEMKTEL